MYKKLTISAKVLALALGFMSTLITLPSFALDCLPGSTAPGCNARTTIDETISTPDDEAVVTSDEVLINESPEEISETELEQEEVDEETGEIAMWTVYLSLGALGTAIILIVIINATGKKKKQL